MQTVAGPVWLPSFISLLASQDPIHQGEQDRERGVQVRKKHVGREQQSCRIRRQASNGRRMREGDRRESTEMRNIDWERKYIS
jgi:hypothetical protein